MKQFCIILLYTFPIILKAQQSEAYSHSSNGEVVIGHSDSFLISEYGGLNIFFEGESNTYEKGFYVLKGGDELIPAMINYKSGHKIRVKKSPSLESKKINAADLSYYKTQVDSFFVVDRVQLKNGPTTKPSILQHLASFDHADYAMYYEINISGLQKKKLLTNGNDGHVWTELDLNEEEPKKILALFISYNKLNKYYDKQELTIEDFLNTLKSEEYVNHYNNGSEVYYDTLWREVKNRDKSAYFGKVTTIIDSLFTMEISNAKHQKLYELHFSSLNPLKKHGTMKVYGENGTVTMEREYSDGDLQATTLYKSGSPIFSFSYTDHVDGEPSERKVTLLGKDSIKPQGRHTFELEFSGEKLHYVVENQQLTSVTKDTDHGRIHYFSNYSQPIDLTRLKKAIDEFILYNTNYYQTSFYKSLEGFITLQLETDYKGRVIHYKIVNSTNGELNKLVNNFCESRLWSDNKSKFRFKKIKLPHKMDTYSFIIPMTFEHRQFFKTFSRPSYNWHWHWQQHMHWQMQQQMMQQSMMQSVPRF